MIERSFESGTEAHSRTDAKRCRVRSLTTDDLAMILAWRNHPEVRAFMFTQHEIGWEEHRAWFMKASCDPSRRLLIVEEADEPLGYVQFTGVAEGGVADWGFYARPEAPKGSGQRLGTAALEEAFGVLGLHKVCGQAIAGNRPSIALHAKLGFIEEGILREQRCVNGAYHSLICFGLLENEWHASLHRRKP